MLDAPVDPSALRMVYLAAPIYAGFLMAYRHFSPRFASERQRAYILSAISSCSMSVMSLPFLYSYLRYGMKETFEAGQGGWKGVLARFSTIFFGTYLFASEASENTTDAQLSLGWFKYRSQVGLLTGWIHHTAYIGLMVYCLNTRQSPVFITACIMELPTFDLAVSNLFPSLRHDLRFLSSFFVIRLAFHLTYLIDCLRPSTRTTMDGSWVPTGVMSLAFVLHASWFHGGVKGYVKRARKATETPAADTTTESNATADADAAESVPGTPEDSPLVTPHTPRSSAILSLPALAAIPQLPNLAQIPTVSIPSFSELTAALQSREHLAAEFKHAVKNRWEEQRGRFTEMRRGAGEGMNLNLNLGRLGLRRRGEVEQVVAAGVDE